MEENLEVYKAFYEDFKHNLIMDFCTAGIKAEVIIDTVITPYICDIVKEGLLEINEENETLEWVRKGELTLLAKEFPIPALKKGYDDARNAKVDYLLTDDENLYMVELKTSQSSESDTQLENYVNALDPSKPLEALFLRILKDNLEINRYGHWLEPNGQYKANKLFGKTPVTEKDVPFSPLIMTGTEKYITTVINILGEDAIPQLNICAGIKKNREDRVGNLLNTIKAKFYKNNDLTRAHKDIKIVYLTLYRDRENKMSDVLTYTGIPYTKKFLNISIMDYTPEDKSTMTYLKWEKVREIFNVLNAEVDLRQHKSKNSDNFVQYALKQKRSVQY